MAIVVLSSAWLLFFSAHLLSDGIPYYRDELLTMLPLRYYLHERLLSGELPQWYPFEGLGTPFLGQIVTATFHPQTFLFLPFTPVLALKLNVLLSYLFGAFGAYLLGREVKASKAAGTVGALAFAFGGYALGVSHNLVYLMGLCTLPWMAWAALRLMARPGPATTGLLGCFWALVFLSGDAQSFAVAALFVPAAFAVHRWRWSAVPWAIGAGILASALIAIELLPALSIAAESIRAEGTASPTLGLTWALHPLRLLEFALPGFVPDAVRNQMVIDVLGGGTALWATTVFAGTLCLALGAAGLVQRSRAAVGFGAVMVVTLWLSLGDRGGLLPATWQVLPILSKFRYPEKYLAFVWTAAVPLVALGFDAIRRRPLRWAALHAAAGAAFAAAAGAVGGTNLISGVWAARGANLTAEVHEAVQSAWTSGLVSGAAFLLGAAFVLAISSVRPLLVLAMPLLVFSELMLWNSAHLPLVDPGAILSENAFAGPVVGAAPPGGPGPRVIRAAPSRQPSAVTLEGAEAWVAEARHLFRVDSNGLSGVTAFGTNLPATSLRYGLLFGVLSEQAAHWGPLFNGCFWTTPRGARPTAGAEVLMENASLDLMLSRSACNPRAHLAAAEPAPTRDAAWERLRRGLQPGRVVWEGGPATELQAGAVYWETYKPEELRLRVEASATSALFVSDQWSAGWTAMLDGRPTDVLPTNVAGRGVLVPAGTHEIEFHYRTPKLWAGVVVSSAGLLALLGLLSTPRLARALRSRREPVKAPLGS